MNVLDIKFSAELTEAAPGAIVAPCHIAGKPFEMNAVRVIEGSDKLVHYNPYSRTLYTKMQQYFKAKAYVTIELPGVDGVWAAFFLPTAVRGN